MGALYLLSGALMGIAGTACLMGADGRFSLLFIPSIILAVGAAAAEHTKD